MKTTISFTENEKLSRFLAKEDIELRYHQTHTASFDMENRVLYLPILENVSEHIFSLLIGHEVSHAIFTPEDCFKKYPDLIEDQTLKGIVNCIEVMIPAPSSGSAVLAQRWPG